MQKYISSRRKELRNDIFQLEKFEKYCIKINRPLLSDATIDRFFIRKECLTSYTGLFTYDSLSQQLKLRPMPAKIVILLNIFYLVFFINTE